MNNQNSILTHKNLTFQTAKVSRKLQLQSAVYKNTVNQPIISKALCQDLTTTQILLKRPQSDFQDLATLELLQNRPQSVNSITNARSPSSMNVSTMKPIEFIHDSPYKQYRFAAPLTEVVLNVQPHKQRINSRPLSQAVLNRKSLKLNSSTKNRVSFEYIDLFSNNYAYEHKHTQQQLQSLNPIQNVQAIPKRAYFTQKKQPKKNFICKEQEVSPTNNKSTEDDSPKPIEIDWFGVLLKHQLDKHLTIERPRRIQNQPKSFFKNTQPRIDSGLTFEKPYEDLSLEKVKIISKLIAKRASNKSQSYDFSYKEKSI